MENVSLNDVIAIQQVPWDYILYFIFVIQVLVLMLLFSGSLRDVLMIAVTVLCLIADKSYIFGFLDGGRDTLDAAIEYHTKDSAFTFAARIAMFALPLVITTQTKIPRAKPALIFLAIVSMVYAFSRWFFQVFPEAQTEDTERTASLAQHSILLGQMGVVFLTVGLFRLGKALRINVNE